MLLLLAQLTQAHAACSFSQTTYADAVEVVVSASVGVIHCRTVTLTADNPLTLDARRVTAEGRTSRLPSDHRRLLPGGGWEVAAPELVEGDRLILRLGLPAEGLTVRFGAAPPSVPDGTTLTSVWELSLDPRHPGWGFADPTHASTRYTDTYSFTADAPAQLLPDGTRYAGGTGKARVVTTAPGAQAQGTRLIPPGRLTLRGDTVSWVGAADPGITVTSEPGELTFDAPSGGTVRWRVAQAGIEPVIPDVATFLAGIEWRFRKVSLPEPAVPVRLKGMRQVDALIDALYDEVHALIDARLPATDPLHPRPLNRAYRSGWATEVERGLILQRFLGQERYPSRWILTGDDPDPATLTGYDSLLVEVGVPATSNAPARSVWLDPSCLTCRPGEISPRWQGKPAVGAPGTPDRVPRQPGHLVRRLRIVGTDYQIRVEASGAAGVWLREAAADADPQRRGARLARMIGAPDGLVIGLSAALRGEWPPGQGPALVEAQPGTEVIELTDGHVPQPIFPGNAPWDGGWEDAL